MERRSLPRLIALQFSPVGVILKTRNLERKRGARVHRTDDTGLPDARVWRSAKIVHVYSI